jgi:hypothetical protein
MDVTLSHVEHHATAARIWDCYRVSDIFNRARFADVLEPVRLQE